jgi:galacturonosyltransferase
LVITYTIKPNVYGGFACRRLGIPYAANITGLGTAFQSQGMLRRLVTVMYKVSLKKAKVVFFENEENRQIFIQEKIIQDKKTCLLMGAGVNLQRYQPTEYPYGDTTKFLFIGRMMREKGIDELFAAMKRLVADGLKVELDILGGYEEDYKTVIEKYEYEGWLHYHGQQRDVRPFIAAAHCFVLPSWHEGMANTNLECAASGRAVITSNIHGCLEAVEDGVSGYLCEKKNADSLYQTMKKFVELSYDKRKAMGLAGRKRMEEIFDKSKVVEDTIKCLLM